MNILAIDTSNQVLGVAVISNQQVLAEFITNINKNHSIRLMPAVDHVMKEAGLIPNELDKIVVAKGPGSYTGIRIGLTTAKTMAWTLKIPIVGVSSLEVVANNGQLFKGIICPFFDARRGQVYTGLYQADGKGHVNQLLDEENILFSEWLEKIKYHYTEQPILFLSNDLSIHKEAIISIIGERAIFPDHSLHIPRPSVLGILGSNREENDDTHRLVPNYLRLVEAEANWLKQQQEKDNE